MSTSAGKVRVALQPVIVAAINDTSVQVTLGYPWPQLSQDIIAIGRVSAQLAVSTMGTRRTRDETVTAEVLISVFRPGGPEQEQVASDRAYALLDAIEHHIRMTDPTLGDVCCQCLLIGHDMDSDPYSDDTGEGRVVEVLATFEARSRIAD